MKISILQPEIERGNIQKNTAVIQKLIHNATGDLLILAEYALTGSLVLEDNVNVQQWAGESELAVRSLLLAEGKKLLINSLINKEERIYNACTLMPAGELLQVKNYLDKPELEAGISEGKDISVVLVDDKKFVITICSDLKEINKISTDGADLLLFIFHFTPENYEIRLCELINISEERKIPIIAASLVSDKNNGHSCYVYGSTVVALGNHEGIMEITL